MKKITVLHAIIIVLHTTPFVHGGLAEDLLKEMTLEQKVGQLFFPQAYATPTAEQRAETEQLIRDQRVGGLLLVYGAHPEPFAALLKTYQGLARSSGNPPLLMTGDYEWGLSMRLENVVRFPRAMTLGALPDETLIRTVAQEIGRQCKAIGVHVNWAPVADVNSNPANPIIGTRSFGDNPDDVARKAQLFADGLRAAGVLACAKHFPGHGDTSVDSHFELPTLEHTRERFNTTELPPFEHLIKNQIPLVMVAHLLVREFDAEWPASLSRSVVTDLLKKELNFDGLVVTDGLKMKAVADNLSAAKMARHAFDAGNHIILQLINTPAGIEALVDGVRNNEIPEAEVGARALKILQAKEQLGLLTPPTGTAAFDLNRLNTKNARSLAQQAYAAAVTLVDPQNAFAPFSPDQPCSFMKIGGPKHSQLFVTLLKNLPSPIEYTLQANAKTGQIEQEASKVPADQPVVIGVFPPDPEYRALIGPRTQQLVSALTDAGKQAVVALCGSPYLLYNHWPKCPVIVAYEDAQNAQEAAARVLLGQQEALGKLPITLPE